MPKYCFEVAEPSKSTMISISLSSFASLRTVEPNTANRVMPKRLINSGLCLVNVSYADAIDKIYWKGVLWSPSYFAGSVGGAPLSILKQYIEQQERPV